MKTVYHEAMHPLGNLGLKISMAALESPHIPMHWHDAMEILFCLNGEVTIQIDHEAFLLSRNQLVVFDSKEMHSIQSASPLYMFLCIHVDKKQMALYCPDLELYHIQCQPLPLDQVGQHQKSDTIRAHGAGAFFFNTGTGEVTGKLTERKVFC